MSRCWSVLLFVMGACGKTTDHDPSSPPRIREGHDAGRKGRVTVVGSGNWGSCVARLLARNVQNLTDAYEPEIRMWVYEEEVDGRLLSEIINTEHENVKYLPGVHLGDNVRAVPELEDACRDASVLVIVVPHQFLPPLLPRIRRSARQDALAVSLMKGLDFDDEGPRLISDMLRRALGPRVCVLMGANVAAEVARDEFCEATVGCHDEDDGRTVQQLFDSSTFRVAVTRDPVAVELCGALKNVVALGAGFCDGLSLGSNTKAAIIRRGLQEMIRFCRMIDDTVQDSTFLESCGVADLITTCYGGRHRTCAEQFARCGGAVTWEDLERDVLGGQKLQGTHTAKRVIKALERRKMVHRFPLFRMIHKIAFEGTPPSAITTDI